MLRVRKTAKNLSYRRRHEALSSNEQVEQRKLQRMIMVAFSFLRSKKNANEDVEQLE